MGAGPGGGPKNLGQKDHQPRTPSSPRAEAWVELFDFSTFPLFGLGEWKELGEVTKSPMERNGQAVRVPGWAAASRAVHTPARRPRQPRAPGCASEPRQSTWWAPGQGCPEARMLPPVGKGGQRGQPCPGAQIRGWGPWPTWGTPCLPTPPSPPSVTLPRNGAAAAWPPSHLPFWSQTPAQRKRVTEEGKVGAPRPAQGRGTARCSAS